MLIKGQWHAHGSAAQFEAALQLYDDGSIANETNNGYQLIVSGGPSFTGQVDQLKISDRIGNVDRTITLDNGSVFVTRDNTAVDAFLSSRKIKGQSKLAILLHKIESHMGWVVFAVALTAVTAFSFFKWGVPWASNTIAHALPHKANQLLSAHTLSFLDDYFFSESELSEERRSRIRAHFQTKLVPLDDSNSEVSYSLHFRKWGEGDMSIPNAFALPAGDIILTDRFVEISESQEEIDSVLLHEMGHVKFRHTLETVVESTMVATVVMVVTGDSNGLADMGIGLGSLLVSSNYSRDHESEADLYAFQKMLSNGIDPDAFARIMQKMTDDMERPPSIDDEPRNQTDQDNQALEEKVTDLKTAEPEKATENSERDEKADRNKSEGILDYLSSHPSTAKRIAQAKRFSQCFKEGKQTCDLNGLE